MDVALMSPGMWVLPEPGDVGCYHSITISTSLLLAEFRVESEYYLVRIRNSEPDGLSTSLHPDFVWLLLLLFLSLTL